MQLITIKEGAQLLPPCDHVWMNVACFVAGSMAILLLLWFDSWVRGNTDRETFWEWVVLWSSANMAAAFHRKLERRRLREALKRERTDREASALHRIAAEEQEEARNGDNDRPERAKQHAARPSILGVTKLNSKGAA